MRILYSHYLASEDHPAVRMVHAVAEGLATLGHLVRVHRSAGPADSPIPDRADAACPGPSEKVGLTKRLRAKAWFAKALWRNRAMRERDLAALREFDPDVVLCRQDAYCYSMQYWCKRFGFPLVVYADAPVAYETRVYGNPMRWHPGRLPETIERLGLQAAESIIAVSRPAKRLLEEVVPGVPIHVIPNGVHPERFEPIDEKERAALREQWGLTAAKTVGFLGTFRPFHGIGLLKELIERTSSRGDVQWFLIGDGPERASLASAADSSRVVFTGKQPPEMIGKLLQLMDIGVAPYQPARGEVYFCPLKVLEYAAAGCAVLGARQGDIPRLLDEGRGGVLLDGAEPTNWAGALTHLLEDDEDRKRLGAAARAHVLANYTWEKTARRVERVLVSTRGGRPPVSEEELVTI